jgi:hypothetical protein
VKTFKADTGHKALRSEQLLIGAMITNEGETIIIHHITDTPQKLQLEIERRSESGIKFERIFL